MKKQLLISVAILALAGFSFAQAVTTATIVTGSTYITSSGGYTLAVTTATAGASNGVAPTAITSTTNYNGGAAITTANLAAIGNLAGGATGLSTAAVFGQTITTSLAGPVNGVSTTATYLGQTVSSSTSGTAVSTALGTAATYGTVSSATYSFTTGAGTGNIIGNTNYIPNYDVMGAHENGGRGCAGCHAPHNGAMGNGGSKLSGYGSLATAQGGLWGEDTSAVVALGTITFNGGLSGHSGQLIFNGTNNWKDKNYTGVATCLSCHDGNVAEGAMMSGYSYEQMFGLLNGVGGSGVSGNRAQGLTTQLYGNNPIPTLLGGGTGAGYGDTHPVGQSANAGAVLSGIFVSSTGTNYGLNLVAGSKPSFVPGTPYANFAATYYPSAVAALVPNATNPTDPRGLYVVCTTCHNQHNMIVYGGGQYGESLPVQMSASAQVKTIFFVNGGYNPGAPYDPTHEPSTMRFCQQCHFSMSSEYFGATNVGTAY